MAPQKSSFADTGARRLVELSFKRKMRTQGDLGAFFYIHGPIRFLGLLDRNQEKTHCVQWGVEEGRHWKDPGHCGHINQEKVCLK